MESKSIRSVLVLIVLALGVVLGVVIVKRANRAPAGPGAAAPIEVPAPRAPTDDRALVRVQRAGAVTAIERGDYESAIAALSAIIKAGNGMGDEVELLKVAKELEEKYRASEEKPTPAKPAPSKPVAAPAPPAAAPPTPAKPAAKKPARTVAKPAPTPAPTIERAEPVTGLLLVTSVPSGLMVELDGKRADNTPLRRRLEVGTHEVAVFRADGQAFRKTVTVEEDGIATVDADVGEPPPPPEPKPLPPPPPEPTKAAPPPEEKRPAPSPVAAPAPPRPGPVGEVLVLQAGLVGDVFIGGVGYGPPPVLAKGIPAGEAAVELRSDGAVKRRKLVTVEAGHRVSVQFR